MTKSSIMLDLDDPRSEKIADVMSNKTSKKILHALADGEKCGSDLSQELKIPLNTVGYNLKKLSEAGLIEKSKRFFWSMKGKKMDYYRVSNRRIVIFPGRIIKGVLPALVVSGLAALGIRFWTNARIESGATLSLEEKADEALVRAGETVGDASATFTGAGDVGTAGVQSVQDAANGLAGLCTNEGVLGIAQNAWLWFFVGALTALFVYLLWNLWRKK
ncbi:MAG: winged helix-turn-helix domain-containing protein [Nanoarchaeota archaeon]